MWPGSSADWQSTALVKEVRAQQPGILVNNRLGYLAPELIGSDECGANEGENGDFGTPEHRIVPVPGKLWESCQVSTWRLWSHTPGERWRSTEQILDMLTSGQADAAIIPTALELLTRWARFAEGDRMGPVYGTGYGGWGMQTQQKYGLPTGQRTSTQPTCILIG